VFVYAEILLCVNAEIEDCVHKPSLLVHHYTTLDTINWRFAKMTLDPRQIAKLRRIISISEKLISVSGKPKRGRPASKNGNGALRSARRRTRRTGKDLTNFRKILLTERKKGTAVAKIAKRHGITPSYIYQL
jgi:hypothetical protein